MKKWNVLENIALIFAVGGLFGATMVLVKASLGSFTPFTIAFLRLAMAALPLLLVLRLRGMRLPPPGKIWWSFTVMGLGNGALAYVLMNWSSQYIEAGMVGILIATTPLFTVVLAHFFTADEPLRPRGMLGIVLGFGGVVILIGPELLFGAGFQGMRLWGEVAMLGAGLCYAVAAVHGRVLKDVPPLITATAQQITGAVAMVPIVLIFESPFDLHPRWEHWLFIAAAAGFGTSLAYMLFFRLLARAGATNTSLVTYVAPLSALINGAIFLGEDISLRAVGAMLLIFFSIALIGGQFERLQPLLPRFLRTRFDSTP